VVSGQTIKIKEIWRDGSGSEYYYVREGDVLRRIEHYSVSKRREDNYVEYEIPLEKIKGKTIYIFTFSSLRNICVAECPAEAFLHQRRPGDYDLKQCKVQEKCLDVDAFRGMRFEIGDPLLERLVADVRKYYVAMLEEINSCSTSLGFKIILYHAKVVENFMKDVEAGLIRCLAMPTDSSRLKCLNVPTAWIYQLWVMTLISKSLGIREFLKHKDQSELVWEMRQGYPHPVAVGRAGSECYAFYFEPQPYAIAHIDPKYLSQTIKAVVGKRHIRPDIVVSRGSPRLLKSPDLLVECKAMPFEQWSENTISQLEMYRKLYNPKNMVLVLFYKIGDPFLKKALESKRVIVVENVRPGDPAVRTFQQIVQKVLG